MGDTVVRKGLPTPFGGGVETAARLNPLAEMVTSSSMLQWIMDGRVYCASDADEDDEVLGIVGTDGAAVATTPTFLLRVPAGTSALPLWVNADQAPAAAGGPIYSRVSFDRVDRYSSGGTSEAISHMRTDRPRAPGCTLYTLPTATAATDARVLYSQGYDNDVTDPNESESMHLNAFERGFFPPLLVGPAALLVWLIAVTTAPSLIWSIGWAEFTSSDLV